MAGVPLLLAPLYVEQDITASNVLRLGAGRRVAPDTSPPQFRAAIDELLSTLNCRNAATALLNTRQGYSPKTAAADIATAMDRLLGMSRPTEAARAREKERGCGRDDKYFPGNDGGMPREEKM